MSEYGADEIPDLALATEITKSQSLVPFDKSNVMQWTYSGNRIVQKYASRQGKTNLLVKFEEPS